MEVPVSYLKSRIGVEDVLREHQFLHCAKDFRDDWERLLAKMAPGDELWRFEPPERGIRIWGVALVRDGRVISTLVEGVD